jgi:hypothetical protein
MYDMNGPLYTLKQKKHGVCRGKWILSLNQYHYFRLISDQYNNLNTKLREHFDPYNNRRIGDNNNMWKFNTKEEPEELIILARLKGLM